MKSRFFNLLIYVCFLSRKIIKSKLSDEKRYIKKVIWKISILFKANLAIEGAEPQNNSANSK